MGKEDGAGGGRNGDLGQAIDDLVRHLAEEAGISEDEAFAALERGKRIFPRRQRERRERRRDFFLLIAGVVVLLLVLAAMHVILTQR